MYEMPDLQRSLSLDTSHTKNPRYSSADWKKHEKVVTYAVS